MKQAALNTIISSDAEFAVYHVKSAWKHTILFPSAQGGFEAGMERAILVIVLCSGVTAVGPRPSAEGVPLQTSLGRILRTQSKNNYARQTHVCVCGSVP